MRTLLIMAALIAVVGVGLGLYRGWFSVSSRHDESKPNVTVAVDKDRIIADKDTVVDKMQDLRHEAEDKIAATTQKAPG